MYCIWMRPTWVEILYFFLPNKEWQIWWCPWEVLETCLRWWWQKWSFSGLQPSHGDCCPSTPKNDKSNIHLTLASTYVCIHQFCCNSGTTILKSQSVTVIFGTIEFNGKIFEYVCKVEKESRMENLLSLAKTSPLTDLFLFNYSQNNHR